MSLDPCPHCWIKYNDLLASPGRESGRRYLNPTQAINPLSRRDNESYICGDCGKAEAMADMMMPNAKGDADSMFRTVIYNDRMEGRRLPAGIPWGPSAQFGLVTSGAYFDGDEYEDKCANCGSMFAWGYMCTDCKEIRPAYEKLRKNPILKEKERSEAEQAKREAQWRREEEERKRLVGEVQDYIGYARKSLCVNCNREELQRWDDYICLRCRATDELAGNPILQHVLHKLDEEEELVPYFILPDGRVVGGGVQRSLKHLEKDIPGAKLLGVDERDADGKLVKDADGKNIRRPLTWEERQDWVCWQDFRNRETGKTLASECHHLILEQTNGLICAECECDTAPHEKGDYLCVYCRHEGADFRSVPVTYGAEL